MCLLFGVGILVALASTSPRAAAQSKVVGWGQQVVDSTWNQEPFVEVAAGGIHSVSLRGDGSVVVWGNSGYGIGNVPALPPGVTYIEVAAGYVHVVALRSDGSVVAWGDNSYSQCAVPALPPGLSY